MLNRRLIRVKVLQAVYAYHQSETKNLSQSVSSLKKSVLGIEHTFNGLFQFIAGLYNFVSHHVNPEDKYLKASKESVAGYKWLSRNACLDKLMVHPGTSYLFSKSAYNWTGDTDFLLLIYRRINESSWFQKYREMEDRSFESERDLLSDILKFLVEHCEEFNSMVEESNLYWADEKIPVLKSAEKLIGSISEDSDTIKVPVLSKDLEDDLDFAERLLRGSIHHHEEFEHMISERTPGWDPERIARIDLYIMIMALVEFTEFQNIPVKVSLNEYLELAKIYSTPQSSKFINGILDSLMAVLKTEGRIRKTGRGLVE